MTGDVRPALLRAVAGTTRFTERLAAGSRTLFNGLWLGVLTDDELAAIDLDYYTSSAAYRTAEWNERGLFDWEQLAVDRHFGGCRRIVVLAAGGGREVLALLRAGFDAVGYEPHPDLAAFGRDLLAGHGHPDRLHLSRRGEVPPGVGPCDGVIVGWGAYSLVSGRHARVRLLAGIRELLHDGGPVLLSYVEREVDDRELRWTASIANGVRRLRGVVPAEVGDTLSPYYSHIFSRAELAEEAAEAGLELVDRWSPGRADRTTSYGCAVAVRR